MLQKPFREYRGVGKIISFSGTEVACEFILQQFSSGRQVVVCASQDPSAWSLVKEYGQKRQVRSSFEGSLEGSMTRVAINLMDLAMVTHQSTQNGREPFEFEFHPLTPVRIEYEQTEPNLQVEYRRGVTNLLFVGTQWVEKANRRYLSRIPLKIQGRDICLEWLEPYEDVKRRLTEGTGIEITAELVTRAPVADRIWITEAFDNICVLLSFATGTWISGAYEDYSLNDHLIGTILLAAKTVPYSHAYPVIQTVTGRTLKEYLETTYPNYLQTKGSLGLDVVIEYLVHSKSSMLLEVKYLIGIIGMECLTSHFLSYSRTKRGATQFTEPYTILNALYRFLTKSKLPDRKTFRTYLEALFKDISMPYEPSDLDFIKIRGPLVHTGRFPNGKDPLKNS